MIDIYFKNGIVIDGTGSDSYQADVGIVGNKIEKIGDLRSYSASVTYDITDKIICPGFVDMHSHADLMSIVEPELLPKLMQGVTTDLIGQDGIGAAPIRPSLVAKWSKYLSCLSGGPNLSWNWADTADFLNVIAEHPTGINLATLLPQGNLRLSTIGLENTQASKEQIQHMEKLVRLGMRQGAVGISLGMAYLPCVFTRREEMVSLFGECAKLGGFLAVHIRNQSDLFLESLEEMITIAFEAMIPLHISHLLVSGRTNWPKMKHGLDLLDKAREDGLETSFDIHPYTAGSTLFTAILPPWALSGGTNHMLELLSDPVQRNKIRDNLVNPPEPSMDGLSWEGFVKDVGWSNIIISSAHSQNAHEIIGKSVADVAANRNQNPEDTALEILEQESGEVGMIIKNRMRRDNIALGIAHPHGMICSDGVWGEKPHPRLYGSFPKFLHQFVLQEKIISLEEAIRKITSLPMQRMGFADRGKIQEGMIADIVVFNQLTLKDKASYDNPKQYPTGIQHVLVNGVHSVKHGEFTKKCGGKVLKNDIG